MKKVQFLSILINKLFLRSINFLLEFYTRDNNPNILTVF